MAEREGFEPPVRFPVQRFSRPPVSTTHTSLLFDRRGPLHPAWLTSLAHAPFSSHFFSLGPSPPVPLLAHSRDSASTKLAKSHFIPQARALTARSLFSARALPSRSPGGVAIDRPRTFLLRA